VSGVTRRWRRRGPRRDGQALVEFALVAPIFFLLLFGVIEGGRFILYYETLSNATREGARYAIVHGSNSYCPSGPMPPGQAAPISCYDATGDNIAQRVKDSSFGLLGSAVSVTTSWLASDGVTAGNNGRDNNVRVAATYTYRTIIPLVPLPAITISAESYLVINN
jgi:Flp pilus assembly protein TadG